MEKNFLQIELTNNIWPILAKSINDVGQNDNCKLTNQRQASIDEGLCCVVLLPFILLVSSIT